MGGATRGDRPGGDAPDAACQCNHRWRRGETGAGGGGDRKISRLRSAVYREDSTTVARAPVGALGPYYRLGAQYTRRPFQARRRRCSRRAARIRVENRRSRDPDRPMAAWRGACGHHAHRFGDDRACAGARRVIRRFRVEGGASRRRLEYGAMGSGRDGDAAARVSTRRVCGGGRRSARSLRNEPPQSIRRSRSCAAPAPAAGGGGR